MCAGITCIGVRWCGWAAAAACGGGTTVIGVVCCRGRHDCKTALRGPVAVNAIIGLQTLWAAAEQRHEVLPSVLYQRLKPKRIGALRDSRQPCAMQLRRDVRSQLLWQLGVGDYQSSAAAAGAGGSWLDDGAVKRRQQLQGFDVDAAGRRCRNAAAEADGEGG
jgi:hypothetical protein